MRKLGRYHDLDRNSNNGSFFSGNLRDIRVFWYYPSAPEARVREFPWVESGDTCSLGNGLLIFRILKLLKDFPSPNPQLGRTRVFGLISLHIRQSAM